jgi:hypothetical protein
MCAPDGGVAIYHGGIEWRCIPHHRNQENREMRKLFRYGGVAASIVLIAIGIGAIITGFNGRDQVRSDLAREQIVGTPDSTIPGRLVDTGSEAQAFADIMRHHTMEATGGKTYSQMGQYLDASGTPTSDKAKAAIDPKTKQPMANQARQIWVTETALTTALNTAYFAENVANFAIVMGFALLLAGAGFAVLTVRALMPLETLEPHRSEPSKPAVAGI